VPRLPQRLERALNFDIETCKTPRGRVKTIACIEDPVGTETILTHLDSKDPAFTTVSRAPPGGLFD
jgi:hypothetical protein